MSKVIKGVPKPISELDFSDFMRRVPIKEFHKDWVPDPVKLPGQFSKYFRRRANGDPTMQVFSIKSEATSTKYNFLTRVDWRGLYIPLLFAPPDTPADEEYKQYHKYKSPDELIGESEIRQHAKTFVNEYEKSEFARNNKDGELFHRFWILDHRKRTIPCLTRPGWRGVWVHEVISEDWMQVEPQKPDYRLYKKPEEVQGETEVRTAARRYLAQLSNITTATTLPKSMRRKFVFTLGPRRNTMIKDVKHYLEHATRMVLTDRQVFTWIIENCWGNLIPDEFKTASLMDQDPSPIGMKYNDIGKNEKTS